MNNESPKLRLIVGIPAPGRCKLHPAFEADYCPTCGTSQVIGGAL